MRYIISIIFKATDFPESDMTWLENILNEIEEESVKKRTAVEILHGMCDRINCHQEAVEISVQPLSQITSIYEVASVQEFGESVARIVAKNLPVSKNSRKVEVKNFFFYSLFSVCA